MYIYSEIVGGSMYFPTSDNPQKSCENLLALCHENAPMVLEVHEMNQSTLEIYALKRPYHQIRFSGH
jgi:hypothetical protein